MLGYGARLPKELMLYVKNMVFLDGAIARLAPELDLLAEVTNISMVFTQRHGDKLLRDLGMDASRVTVDLDSVKAGFGVDLDTERLTYRELQERRALIQKAHALPCRVATWSSLSGCSSFGACASSSPVARSTTPVDCQPTRLEVRLIMVKADGCVAIHADGGAYKTAQLDERPEHHRRQRRSLGGDQSKG